MESNSLAVQQYAGDQSRTPSPKMLRGSLRRNSNAQPGWGATLVGSSQAAADNNRRIRILCLDGGGIRGISALLILEKIMDRIKDRSGSPTTLRPCEYFDLIGGTSTGGIIAIMLGPLRMTVVECIRSYKDMAARAFTPVAKERSSSRSPWNLWRCLTSCIPHLPARPTGAFSGVELAEAVKEIVARHHRTGNPEALFADTSCCKT